MTQRASISAYRGPALVVGVLFLVLIAIPVFDHGSDYVFEWLELKTFMETCPHNELRIESFAEGNLRYYYTEADYLTTIINLSTGAMTNDLHRSIPFDGFNSFSPLFLFTPTSFSSDESRLKEIKRILPMLATPEKSEDVSYRYQVHVAFWRENDLCVYHYARADRPKLLGLAMVLGADYWFHGH